MFSSSTRSTTTRPNKPFQVQWNWRDSQYRELCQLYMNFVDYEEVTKGRPPNKPHRNQVLIQCAFGLFDRVAPRDCIISALRVCHLLEEEPYELAMDPMAELRKVNSRQRTQWDILKVERIKDQIAQYELELALIPAAEKQIRSGLKQKIEERQKCLQRHPTRYYRPAP